MKFILVPKVSLRRLLIYIRQNVRRRRNRFKVLVLLLVCILFVTLVSTKLFEDISDFETQVRTTVSPRSRSRICNVVISRNLDKNKENQTFYSSEQLLLATKFLIDRKNYCNAEFGQTIELVAIVFSTVSSFLQRSAIRDTWGSEFQKRNVTVLFLTGKSLDEEIQKKVQVEASKFNDLLQSPFIDDYYNETLKAIAMLTTLAENCKNVKFVVKTDQDVIVNVDNVFAVTAKYSNSRNVIFGDILTTSPALREVDSPWYMPKFIWKPYFYPAYPSGGIYMFTGDISLKLLICSLESNPFYVDDAYIMGVAAATCGVNHINVPAVGPKEKSLNSSVFYKQLAIHSFNHEEILKLWAAKNQTVV